MARPILLQLMLLGLLAVPAAARAQGYGCIGPDDADARYLRDYVVSLVSATSDTTRVHTRVAYQLPAGSNIAVTIETRRQTCVRAARRLNQLLAPRRRPISRRVIVIKVGKSHWVVMDPKVQVGKGYHEWFIFDSRWRKVRGFYG